MPIAVRERGSRVREYLLCEVLGTMRVARPSAEVSIDLRMVSPEGQIGEAFHLLPLSLGDGEGNGL